MKEEFKVYWMQDLDLPEVMFTGTWDECKAFIAADRKKNGRNIHSRFYAIHGYRTGTRAKDRAYDQILARRKKWLDSIK
jgi:hypothetical protein